MSRVRIGDSWVGDGEPTYIIAEAGSNHNGNLDQAFRLIDVAVEAGANAVKFQHFKAARLYPRSAGQSDYLGVPRSIFDIIQEMEMPDTWVPEIAAYCAANGVDFLSSPFDESAVDLLDRYVPAFKVASYEMTHTPLLRHIAGKGKPVVMSTGTATLDEVVHAVGIVRAEGNKQIVVLQCTASYPAPLETINARAITTLREATGAPVGLSDHSRDPIVAPVVAVALGACLIEKHFTLSNRLPGPDHKFAVEPDELKLLVRRVREAEAALGHGRKETQDAEQELRAFARRSVFASREIPAGETLTAANVAVLRCGKLGFGLPPEAYDTLLGRVARRTITVDRPVRLEDVV